MPCSPNWKAPSTCSGRPGHRPASRAACLPAESQPAGTDSAERGLLRAVFAEAPVPLLLLTHDGTVQRRNRSAGDLIGAKPGYATGRPFAAFVALPSRAAVNSQLTAVGRTGKQRRIRCSLIAADGLVPCELVIGRIGIRGTPDDADPLLIAVRDADARPPAADGAVADGAAEAQPKEAQGESAGGARLSGVQAITRRLDLVTAVARLLLENEGFSESRTLQRCARLIARELTAWVIVDMERRNASAAAVRHRPGRPRPHRADQRPGRGRPAARIRAVRRARIGAPGPHRARRGRRRSRRRAWTASRC